MIFAVDVVEKIDAVFDDTIAHIAIVAAGFGRWGRFIDDGLFSDPRLKIHFVFTRLQKLSFNLRSFLHKSWLLDAGFLRLQLGTLCDETLLCLGFIFAAIPRAPMISRSGRWWTSSSGVCHISSLSISSLLHLVFCPTHEFKRVPLSGTLPHLRRLGNDYKYKRTRIPME